MRCWEPMPRLLTEGEEIKSHDLFARLLSKKTLTGEDDGDESETEIFTGHSTAPGPGT